ncbi:branched-chain amino acid ABC transporter permease [Nocardioides anomalus]|uniref:Branched-chain amino acid ABC transporter permease n=1 Tax=Nocardioides anomalus TaxID=2712223 RepID=A0A6G6WID1_9ACTN|nr:branched-chain amino acid ABC transporter permease [Nocardioides anomalus]QIG45088.1 branched-chain amino acid ABC transporter permease [Nocardioides anomalus]
MTTTEDPATRRTAAGPSRATDRWPPLAAAAGIVLLLLWMRGSDYRADLLVLACTYALVALGMYLPFVMAGSLSMAYSAYAAIGAYSVGLVSQETSLPIWLGWLVGALVSAVIAVLLSLSTRRLSGFYLAAVTLLFGTAFEGWLGIFDVFGGAGGIGQIRAPSFAGWEPDRTAQVVLAMLLVLVLATLLDRVRRSSWGALVRAMREHPLPVEASGVRTADLTSVCLAVGAAIASFGGALFASFVRGVTPETFTLNVVFLAIFMPLIGGRNTAWGAVVGALLVVELSLNLDVLETSGQLVLAVAVLLILLIAPAGVLGYLGQGLRAVTGRGSPPTARRTAEEQA